MSNDITTLYASLKKSSSSTANFRFNAYRRLDFLDKSSNLALIVSSSSLIITSITIEILKNKTQIPDYINVGQICIPIIVLALSIMISNCKYGLRSEKMHECAQILNHYSKLLDYKVLEKRSNTVFSKEEYTEYKDFCCDYSKILSKFDNHSDIDRTSQKIKEHLKRCIITSPLRDCIAFIFNISTIGYFYILVNISSLAWALHVIKKLIWSNYA